MSLSGERVSGWSGGGKYTWCVVPRGKDHLWVALGFVFARVELDTGTRCQILCLLAQV